MCLSFNEIAGFFDHQYLWKELIDFFAWWKSKECSIWNYHFLLDVAKCAFSYQISGFFHGVSHQGKVVSETTILVGCGKKQIAKFFDLQFLWKESNTLVCCMGIVIKGR